MEFDTLNNPHLKKIASEILSKVEYVISEEAVGKKFKNKVRNVLDIGANCGAFSKRCLHDFPNAEIIAIEPNPKLWAVLERNLSSQRVKICKAALIAGKQKKVALYIGKLSPAQNSLIKNFLTKRKSIEVDSLSVSDLILLYKIKNIDILKIDIEGMEVPVINSFIKNKDDLPKVIFIEFHSVTDRIKLDRLLVGSGYVLVQGTIKFPNRGNLAYVTRSRLSKKYIDRYAIKMVSDNR